MFRCTNKHCDGPSDDLVGGGFHSRDAAPRCRSCGHEAEDLSNAPLIIQAKDYAWKRPVNRYPKLFVFPDHIKVRFPDGSEYDSTGHYDASDNKSGRNLEGTTMEGSPVHQAIVAAGILLQEV